jgi:hypothetical protein
MRWMIASTFFSFLSWFDFLMNWINFWPKYRKLSLFYCILFFSRMFDFIGRKLKISIEGVQRDIIIWKSIATFEGWNRFWIDNLDL